MSQNSMGPDSVEEHVDTDAPMGVEDAVTKLRECGMPDDKIRAQVGAWKARRNGRSLDKATVRRAVRSHLLSTGTMP